MDIGSRFLPDGTCRFRVYAPFPDSMAVDFPARKETRPLVRDPDGYWSAAWKDIVHGERYLYRLGDRVSRPDPASHSQPEGVHAASQAWDHSRFRWSDSGWAGIPPEDMVIYELHAGTFTAEGSLEAVAGRLDHLSGLGVNAIELMPVSQFPGRWGWGYDGVYPYAVHAGYGGPDSLKRLVDACHARGIAVILDVVYNHLGPEGNYLAEFGPYFTDHYKTPWGKALNFDGADCGPVREYFIGNALHWFRDYHVDALRLDAVHQIYDVSARPFLAELGGRVEELSRRDGGRRFLIAESDLNDTRIIQSRDTGGYGLDAQWLDDFHHCVDVMLHPDRSGYRRDYGEPRQLIKAFREGFVYTGEWCPTRRRRFGKSSSSRPGREFVVFVQNHDQVGNRLTGDRISTLSDPASGRLAAACMLLSPYIPLLFMGEEYGEENPFLFFADYGDAALRDAVREGRKREFNFLETEGEIPDPVSESSFLASRLDWSRLERRGHRQHLEFYRALLRLRRSSPALSRPDRENLEMSGLDRVFWLRRWHAGSAGLPADEFAAFLNFNPGEARAHMQAREGIWDLVLDSASEEWGGPGTRAPARLDAGADLALPALSAAVYRKRRA